MSISVRVPKRWTLCCSLSAVTITSGLLAPARAEAACEVGWFEASYYDASKNWAQVCERTIDHKWFENGPKVKVSNAGKSDRTTEFDADNFGAVWEGRFLFAAGTFTFVAETDDGMRVFIDGRLILDEWRNQGIQHYEVRRQMSAGEHQVKVVYYEDTNDAEARFWWRRQ
jgi:PA14 domain